MIERDVRDQINKLFRCLNYNADTPPDAIICGACRNMVRPSIGQPDVTMMSPTGLSCYVEVKVVLSSGKRFNFASITTEQRGKLTAWMDKGGMGYLGLGIIVQASQHRDKLERLYLVEWSAWLEMETKLRQYQSSIPVKASKGYRKELQAQKLDIVTLLSDWQVSYIRGSGWQLPMTHPAQHQLRLVD